MISAFIKTCDDKIGGKDKIWNQPTDVGPGRSKCLRKSDFRTMAEKSFFFIRSHLPPSRTTFCRTNRCRAIFFFLQLPSELSGSFRLPTRGYFRWLICISANRLLSYCLKRSNDHDTFSVKI